MTQFDNKSWDDGWETDDSWHAPALASSQPARQAIVNDARTTVQHFHFPPQPQPPPTPPRPQIVYAPPSPPPKVDDLVLAGGVFAVGVILIAVVTGFSAIWFGIVAVFLGLVALVSGFALFISWTDRYASSRR